MKFLLVTDLDNTLVGDEQATLTLNHQLLAMRGQIGLIYATGRSYASAQQLKVEQQLLQPDYWVTGVGTEIYAQGLQDQNWAEQLSQDWNREAIALLTQSIPELIPQPADEQNPWKLSFLLHSNAATATLTDLQTQLMQARLSAQVIFSSDEDVDILPHNGNKGLAITHLRKRLKILPEKTLVCGDSGNDISLFQQSTLGVIVGNARSELLEWYRQHGQPHQYLANSAYASGILEALNHFELL